MNWHRVDQLIWGFIVLLAYGIAFSVLAFIAARVIMRCYYGL